MMDASSSPISTFASDSCGQATSTGQVTETDSLSSSAASLRHLLMNENASLEVPLEDSQFLFKFLRLSNSNVEEAQRKIVKYYSYQLSYPEVFSSTFDESMRLVFESNILWVSPVSKCQQPVILFSPGNWNPDVISFDVILNAFAMTMEVFSLSIDTQMRGVVSIIDTSNVSWSHIKSFGPSHAKKVVTLVEEVAPCKITNIHVLNRSQLAKMAVQVIKPFLNPELTARSKLHSDLQSLKNAIGSDVLPSELGGDLPPVDPSYWLNQLLSKRQESCKYWSTNSCYGFTVNASSSTAMSASASDETPSQNFIVRQLMGKKEPLMENLPKLPSCVTSFFR